jgi:ADP-ribosylglycohydrolase
MIGAIAGDIIGSVYEHRPIKNKDFPLFDQGCRFTDDTVLTVAIADAILKGWSYREALIDIGRRYPQAGYGRAFYHWLHSEDPQPYNSWGNGSAMRVSPVGFAFSSQEDVLLQAKKTAEVSHSHPEGIKGAQATALAIFQARMGFGKEQIRAHISKAFNYDLNRTVDEIRPTYSFDISCQGTVPEAIIAFLDSVSYEDAIRNAVSLGGDSDTQACITGGIAEAYYGGVPGNIRKQALDRLPSDLFEIIDNFCQEFDQRRGYMPNPEETQALKLFVRDGLGCGCPDEVFSFIQIKKNPDVFRGLPIDYLVTIGDRLLVAICLSESLNNGMGADIKESLAAGKQLRDRAGFNRFRLVVASEDADSIVPTIQEQFSGLTGLDDRVHLHVVPPSVLPGFFARMQV